MTAHPHWSPVDDETADLLALVAYPVQPRVDFEWQEFVATLRWAANPEGVIYPNTLRPLVRGVIAPRRIGAFINRALAQQIIAPTGDWQESDDTEGRNAGKPARIYKLGARDATRSGKSPISDRVVSPPQTPAAPGGTAGWDHAGGEPLTAARVGPQGGAS